VKRAKLLIFNILFRGQVYDIMTIEGYSLRDEKPGDKELHYILSRTLARILPASGDVGNRENTLETPQWGVSTFIVVINDCHYI
jgi:hypothetical protein